MKIVAVATVIVVLILSISLIMNIGSAKHRVDWSVDIDGTVPGDVKVNQDGTIFVWTKDQEQPGRPCNSYIYGFGQDAVLKWDRSYNNISAVTYGGISWMIVAYDADGSGEESTIVGFDQFNRSKMGMTISNMTPISMVIADDMGMFVVGHSNDERGTDGKWTGDLWMTRYWSNGTVRWQKPCAEMTLRYMSNGTLVAVGDHGATGIDRQGGEALWNISFPGSHQLNYISSTSFFCINNDSSLSSYDMDGTLRWVKMGVHDDSAKGVETVDEMGTCYLISFNDPLGKFELLGIKVDGNIVLETDAQSDWGLVGLDAGVLTEQDGTMRAYNDTGSLSWECALPNDHPGRAWYDPSYREVLAISVDERAGDTTLMVFRVP